MCLEILLTLQKLCILPNTNNSSVAAIGNCYVKGTSYIILDV
jgi:hypothetical protein